MSKKDINKFIENVREYLTEKYGKVYPQWEAVIYLLQDNLNLYEECKQSIKENGLYDKQSGRKNPLIASLKDLQATILKEVQHLGISPYSSSKIKMEENGEEDELLKFFDS